ncbi:tRNA (guanosine(37)-N1)-methyltransferase TrmD [Cyanobacterium sp. IPPAS B-1200]|uniref:tRNA (guanosine(37)-N1)-methyltransferase TrmD n=1 Tax=Cyanobacterium sp. IPPAS B-1200 TaxID=1562720 RepID=UPI0008525255|nr:tRNA (guanosine(37)-N1)-methyltransferase TrmD [Cyanobacterium sp. IPPAS B-1200]OEJ78983.1 tRNA (guanosine(37)-N1)-methyltransferase TrmD [Cyanobacterium sp. IPPAS B-1200]
MEINVITLFPDFFTSALHASLLGRALKKQIATVNLINPRDFTTDKHRTVDDVPYGGGVGMVLKPEPIFAAVESVPNMAPREVIMLTPQGQRMDQNLFKDLSTNYRQLILICGHYEGIDERVQHLVTREVSLGDFVLTGGEIPALTLMDGVIRLLPGTVGKKASLEQDSFEDGLLDYPHYTRPPVFRGWEVPEVLRSGNHGAIAHWRHQQQLEATRKKRPDLLPEGEIDHGQ